MPMTVAQGFTRALSQSEPWPLPVELHPAGFKIRRGQLVMVAGASGCGKSAFTSWLVKNMDVEVLYGSADMDPFDATVRIAAMETGHTADAIEAAMKAGMEDYYLDVLRSTKMHYFFDSTPDLDDICAELDAWVEIHDSWPDVLVVDNLVNLQGSEEYQGKMYLLSELHSLAHSTGITVFILHHASEANQKDPTKPASKKEIDSKVTHYPELVLTVALDQEAEIFRVAVVKQRGGKADATGKTFIELAADPARCSYSKARLAAVRDYWSEVE